jgi:hypothetical protein
MGELGILNVGAGDTKLVFDKNNPADCIRAAEVVRDMLRRGYAVLIEVDDGQGGKTHTRAVDFDVNTTEYIIADDPASAQADADLEAEVSEEPAPIKGRRRRVAATDTRGVAVARTAGG